VAALALLRLLALRVIGFQLIAHVLYQACHEVLGCLRSRANRKAACMLVHNLRICLNLGVLAELLNRLDEVMEVFVSFLATS